MAVGDFLALSTMAWHWACLRAYLGERYITIPLS